MSNIKEEIKNKTLEQLEDMQKDIMKKENLSIEERINKVTEIEEYKVQQLDLANNMEIQKIGEIIVEDEST